jgi:hypothetical protein
MLPTIIDLEDVLCASVAAHALAQWIRDNVH